MSKEKEPWRVYRFSPPLRAMNKPSPWMARSVVRPVSCDAPCAKLVEIARQAHAEADLGRVGAARGVLRGAGAADHLAERVLEGHRARP